MPKVSPKRQPKPVTREELNEALRYTVREILTQMNARMGNLEGKIGTLEQGLRREIRDGFERTEVKLDGTLELFPTRKEVHAAFQRLSRVLRPHGIKIEPEALLKP